MGRGQKCEEERTSRDEVKHLLKVSTGKREKKRKRESEELRCELQNFILE
jgi:hypothetical protein